MNWLTLRLASVRHHRKPFRLQVMVFHVLKFHQYIDVRQEFDWFQQEIFTDTVKLDFLHEPNQRFGGQRPPSISCMRRIKCWGGGRALSDNAFILIHFHWATFRPSHQPPSGASLAFVQGAWHNHQHVAYPRISTLSLFNQSFVCKIQTISRYWRTGILQTIAFRYWSTVSWSLGGGWVNIE